MKEASENGKILHLDCAGGYTNLHVIKLHRTVAQK
jgi:hypothetical protein